MTRSRFWPLVLLLSLLSACHGEVTDAPLSTRLISVRDKFYDVKALSAEKAVVVGYTGKILVTTDGGKNWQAKQSGTDLALYNVKFVDAQTGWVCGQDGLILHTTDGGETWHKQESGINQPIFALSFTDQTTAGQWRNRQRICAPPAAGSRGRWDTSKPRLKGWLKKRPWRWAIPSCTTCTSSTTRPAGWSVSSARSTTLPTVA